MTADRARFGAAHAAWLALACSILIWGVGELRPGELGNTGNWYRIVLVLFAGCAGIFALLRNVARLPRAFPLPLLLFLVYGLVALVSSTYVPAYALYAMWKGFEVVVDVIVIAAVLSHVDARASVRLAFRVIVALFVVLLVAYWAEAAVMPSAAFFPSRGLIPFTMQGILPIMNGNALAFLSAVVAYAAFCSVFRSSGATRRSLALILMGWASTTLLLAQSRTSLIGLTAAVCVYLTVDRRWGLLLLVALGAAVAAASTPFIDVTERYLIRGQSEQLLTSLSGRTHAWSSAWSLFQQSPILGHGFAAAARVEILGTGAGTASTLHGAIFDVMVGVGLLGLIPWLGAIVSTVWRMARVALHSLGVNWRAQERSEVAMMSGLLALVLVRSTTSSGLAMHDHTLMLFLVVLAFAAVASRRSARHAAEPEGAEASPASAPTEAGEAPGAAAW